MNKKYLCHITKIVKLLSLVLISVSIFFAQFSFAKTLSPEELMDTLSSLKVASDCKTSKYLRKEWKHWISEEKGGYNTRQRVLIEESLITPMVKLGSKKIAKGRWYCPYKDKLFNSPKDLDIDHLVPLGETHKSGGCNWDKEKKKNYANYLKNKEELIAVSKGANRSKGQKDPAKWLPKNEDYLCEYISDWLTIKKRWQLWIDQKEKEAIAKIIEDHCINTETDFAFVTMDCPIKSGNDVVSVKLGDDSGVLKAK